MRPHIESLDTKSMPWTERGTGAYSKLLSTDPDNGARTALQRVVPSGGAKAPSVPHYHPSDEELLIIKGSLTFDSKTWLNALSYCFHPAQIVHGFKSSIPEETWFISRHSQEMETFQIPEPEKWHYHSIAERPPERGLAVLTDPSAGPWEDDADRRRDMRCQSVLLSRDPVTGEGSKLVRFLPGAVQRRGAADGVYEETFVLEGALTAEDGSVCGEGFYSFRPPGAEAPFFESPDGALVYVNFGPR
jgi:quercetin dioxygenase-like cupin family protein